MIKNDFLPKDKNKNIWQKDFTLVYLPIAIVASIGLILANFIALPYVIFSFPIVAGIFYVFYAVLSVGSKKLLLDKIKGHEIALSVCFLIVKLSLGGDGIIYSLFLPIVFLIGLLITCIYIIKYRKEFSKHYIDFALISLATVIPCAICFIFGFSLFIPSVVIAGVGVGALIITSLLNLKMVKSELKKYFHM